jgi:serine protease AprX
MLFIVDDNSVPSIATWVKVGPQATTGVNPAPRAQARLSAYPNPFAQGTTLHFAVPTRGQATVSIYDASGRLVRVLDDQVRDPGAYSIPWAGRDQERRHVVNGVYFARLETPLGVETVKLIVRR